MRIFLIGTALAGLLLAGCSSERAPDRSTQSTGPSPAAHVQEARSGASTFASLADRGELLAYPSDRKVERAGAYTRHPVEVSEAHAFNAMTSGKLRLTMPDGHAVAIDFKEFQDHSDGNWSWVGSQPSGEHAVLTFGERAVFGEIFSGGKSYRIQTRGNAAWLIETDLAALAGRDPRHTGGASTDILLPGDVSNDSFEAAGAKVAATTLARSVAKASPSPVIDLVLGYSNGLVAQLQSESAVVTNLNSLVALANAAYARSGLTMRLRLVKTVAVNFPDDTDNEDVLQKLTGYNATTRQRTTPDAAFKALRDAREEFGGDLVSLVRPYRAPEQKGCGIAWLLGAGGEEIVPSDEYFGYSVVSLGGDRDESDGHDYDCSPYSLAHELGHLMGQAHNKEDSQYQGTHAYSYGYREASSNGFHTIMAYPLANGSQNEIGNFANPAVLSAGRPTGVAGQADNVLSMKETMPIVSAFRALVVPLPSSTAAPNFDFNGDGVADVLWRHSSNGQNVIWPSAVRGDQLSITTVTDNNWHMVGYGDFNKDGKSDIVWRHATTGANAIWLSANRATQQSITTVTNKDWKIVGVGDFNGDGVADLLWRDMAKGTNAIWLSGKRETQRSVTAVTNLNWKVVGVGDFDRDGRSDILWRDVVTGANAIWLSGNRATQRNVTSRPDVNWEIVGVGDFNGDGASDIFWRNRITGANEIWLSGLSTNVRTVAAASAVTRVAAIGDYDGDGVSDVLWRNTTNGNNVIWRSADSTKAIAIPGVPDQRWLVQPRNY